MVQSEGGAGLRETRVPAAVLALLMGVGLHGPALAEDPARLLVLVDDRGEPLEGPVDVCFVRGLETDCVEQAPKAPPMELRRFDLLRIEGPDHGPLTLRPGRLTADDEGQARVAVPRKATLQVAADPELRLTVALHAASDLDPLRSTHRLDLPPGGGVKVPAGVWILSLEARGLAPDLHRLPAAPGSTHRVRHRASAGWSLVLRTVSKDDGDAVPGARVEVRPAEPPAPPEEPEPREPPRTADTGADGLALVSGMDDPVVDAEVRHPQRVRTTLPGISSSPGSLELREVELGRGAILEAEVRVDGETAAGWRCAVLDRKARSAGGSREVWAQDAGADGVCRGDRLPEGPFWLRVTAPQGARAAEREVRFYDGEIAQVTLDLSPVRVEGEVRKGQEPGAGYRVRIFRIRETGATYFVEPVAEAVTDELGAYEVTLWDAGLHRFNLDDPEGRSADSERVDVQGLVTRVDFHLAVGDIEGVVVSPDGEPVSGASVIVRLTVGSSSSAHMLRSADDGTFRLPREAEAGEVEVSAEHAGYQPASIRLTLTKDTVAPPLVLTLRRDSVVRGRVVTAGGAPAPGVLVMSSGGGPGSLGSQRPATTDGEGRFEVTRSPAGATRLYVTGPGCPLMTADVSPEAPEPVLLSCAAASGTLALRFVDAEGRPVSGLSVSLRRGAETFPATVLGGHLYSLGQATASDGSGRLVIPGLSPGTYDVYLGSYGTEPVELTGTVGSVPLLPGQVQELEVVVRRRR